MKETHFKFGDNWKQFLDGLNDMRIAEAEASLITMLRRSRESWRGIRFLDVGNGSGLFSLAARRLGASVHSFDYDPQAVECARWLRERYFQKDPEWIIEQGSIIDDDYVTVLGQHDIVYSWGVLHHTGNLQKAMENVSHLVADRGLLFIAIYNAATGYRYWRIMKRLYNRLPGLLKKPFAALIILPNELLLLFIDILRLRPLDYIRRWKGYYKQRGMSRWIDIVDWVGGYPYEVARPEDVFEFYRQRGFQLEALTTTNNLGINQFVFARMAMAIDAPSSLQPVK